MHGPQPDADDEEQNHEIVSNVDITIPGMHQFARNLNELQSALRIGKPDAADAAFAAAQKAVDQLDPECALEWSAARVTLFRIWRQIRNMPERRIRRSRWN